MPAESNPMASLVTECLPPLPSTEECDRAMTDEQYDRRDKPDRPRLAHLNEHDDVYGRENESRCPEHPRTWELFERILPHAIERRLERDQERREDDHVRACSTPEDPPHD